MKKVKGNIELIEYEMLDFDTESASTEYQIKRHGQSLHFTKQDLKDLKSLLDSIVGKDLTEPKKRDEGSIVGEKCTNGGMHQLNPEGGCYNCEWKDKSAPQAQEKECCKYCYSTIAEGCKNGECECHTGVHVHEFKPEYGYAVTRFCRCGESKVESSHKEPQERWREDGKGGWKKNTEPQEEKCWKMVKFFTDDAPGVYKYIDGFSGRVSDFMVFSLNSGEPQGKEECRKCGRTSVVVELSKSCPFCDKPQPKLPPKIEYAEEPDFDRPAGTMDMHLAAKTINALITYLESK